eukprot:TRINITY_DN1000_c0_g2_i1.p1 TRINITY_DN1000_c0_g2~~TRINITY_DN1000_c0_g2_i1.p1  ORF type:complete len:510 (-),score=72.32 TRINITY_DN1000_c0_g2_i1:182-1711(-)
MHRKSEPLPKTDQVRSVPRVIRRHHKSEPDRWLQLLRRHVGTALDALETDGDDVPTIEDVEMARDALREIDVLVRKLQVETKPKSKVDFQDAHFDSSIEASEMKSWLTLEFTNRNDDAARSYQLVKESSRPRSMTSYATSISPSKVASKILSNLSVQESLEAAGTCEFDAIKFAKNDFVAGSEIAAMGEHLIMSSGLPCALEEQGALLEGGSQKEFKAALEAFFTKVDDNYKRDIHFHTAAHAVDVASSVQRMMSTEFMISQTTTVDHIMVIVASLIHDVGHPGKNSAYLTKIMDPLAIRYNDQSILENMHLALSFSLMQGDDRCNWLKLLQGPTRSYVRRALIDMVLGTDMSKHSDRANRFQHYIEEYIAAQEGDEQPVEDEYLLLERKLLLLGTVLHSSDIANPCKPQPLMLAWTRKVSEEFWEQGDEEAKRGLPISLLCDREGTAGGMATVPNGQLGFINFIVQPFFEQLATLMPELQADLAHIAESKKFWAEKQAEKASYKEIFG